jgi:hypothetical protein
MATATAPLANSTSLGNLVSSSKKAKETQAATIIGINNTSTTKDALGPDLMASVGANGNLSRSSSSAFCSPKNDLSTSTSFFLPSSVDFQQSNVEFQQEGIGIKRPLSVKKEMPKKEQQKKLDI